MAETLPRMLATRDALRQLSVGHTRLYELIARGEIIAYKMGARTVVSRASINHYLDNLPKAKIALPARDRRKLAAAAERVGR